MVRIATVLYSHRASNVADDYKIVARVCRQNVVDCVTVRRRSADCSVVKEPLVAEGRCAAGGDSEGRNVTDIHRLALRLRRDGR